MHPRSPYRTPPDYAALARSFPELKPYISRNANGTVSVDYQDEAALRCLTRALLYRDFGLTVDLPKDRLCPTVPNRLNYILWIEDVLNVSSLSRLKSDSEATVRGLDIGTGASAIYPLLGCRVSPRWAFYATDIDAQSLAQARANITRNDLQDRITLVAADPKGSIFGPLESKHDATFDFTMCNPPFYSSEEDIAQSAAAKKLASNAVCTGAAVEMITPGGEAAFVVRMVRESLALKTRCHWYTSMLGKMSSLTEIVGLLRENLIDNYAITEFVQGQTRRWAIAWSFGHVRLPDSLARLSGGPLQSLMPTRNTCLRSFALPRTVLHKRLILALDGIEGTSQTPVSILDGFGDVDGSEGLQISASRDTWSRAARRKRQHGAMDISLDNDEVGMKCLIKALPVEEAREGAEAVVLECTWVYGHERALFESFWGHVCRKIEEANG